jgi:hypothetical protein
VSPAEEMRIEDRVELAVSNPADLSSLRDWLRAQPDVEVRLASGVPAPGELGVADVVTVLASSSGVVAAIKTLPAFLRARSPKLRIEATIRQRRFTLDATNVEDVLPIIERLLADDGQH